MLTVRPASSCERPSLEATLQRWHVIAAGLAVEAEKSHNPDRQQRFLFSAYLCNALATGLLCYFRTQSVFVCEGGSDNGLRGILAAYIPPAESDFQFVNVTYLVANPEDLPPPQGDGERKHRGAGTRLLKTIERIALACRVIGVRIEYADSSESFYVERGYTRWPPDARTFVFKRIETIQEEQEPGGRPASVA